MANLAPGAKERVDRLGRRGGGGGEEEELLCTLMRYPIPLNILTYSVFNGIHALGLKMT